MPEYEIFDLGHLTALQRLLDKHGLPAGGHVHVDFVMGVPGGMPGTAEALVACAPGDARPARGHHVLGHRHRPHARSRSCSPRSSAGGHLRVGMEDTVTYAKGQPVESQHAARRPRGRLRPARPASAADRRREARDAARRIAGRRSMAERTRAAMPLAEVVRSGFVEGRAPRLGGGARRRPARWSPRPATSTAPIFPRSSNKPLQAVGMLRAGLRLADPADLALVCAQPLRRGRSTWRRVRGAAAQPPGWTRARCAARRTCRSAERGREAVLRAGGGPTPRPDELLRQARRHAADLRGGRLAAGGVPATRAPAAGARSRAAVEELAGEPAAAVGVDGCGAPVLAMSLTGLARAFLRLVDRRAAARRSATVADAMRAHPELVAGTGADDTRLMRGVPGPARQGRRRGRAGAWRSPAWARSPSRSTTARSGPAMPVARRRPCARLGVDARCSTSWPRCRCSAAASRSAPSAPLLVTFANSS